jgi:predicted transcriptional regulator
MSKDNLTKNFEMCYFIISYIEKHGSITTLQLSKSLNIGRRKAQRYLTTMVNAGYLLISRSDKNYVEYGYFLSKNYDNIINTIKINIKNKIE